jgi:signal transduction histidine kinase
MKERRRRAALLGHELRNPLAPVLNAVQIIQREGGDKPTLKQAADMIDCQMRCIVRLVDDLLDVSRITQGKIQLRRKGGAEGGVTDADR